MSILRKKVTPEELETRLTLAESSLNKREEQAKRQSQKARDSAKEALKTGNGRAYNVASRKYAHFEAYMNTIGSMVETIEIMKDVVQEQEGFKEIIQVGKLVVDSQRALGLDPERTTKAIGNIKGAVTRLQKNSEMVANLAEVMGASSPESTRAQEMLRAELTTEIELEGATEGELGKKIKQAAEK